jgi:hypothetical protein
MHPNKKHDGKILTICVVGDSETESASKLRGRYEHIKGLRVFRFHTDSGDSDLFLRSGWRVLDTGSARKQIRRHSCAANCAHYPCSLCERSHNCPLSDCSD